MNPNTTHTRRGFFALLLAPFTGAKASGQAPAPLAWRSGRAHILAAPHRREAIIYNRTGERMGVVIFNEEGSKS